MAPVVPQPSPYLGIVRAPIINEDKTPSWALNKLFQDWDQRLTNGLNLIGEFIGNIGASATIGSRPEPISITVGHIDSLGVMQGAGMAPATSSTQGSVVMPPGAVSNVLGGASTHAATDFDASGAAAAALASAQTYTNNASNVNSGTLPAAVLPTPAPAALGGVKSATASASHFATGIDTSGNPTFAQPAFTDISGSATTSQVPALSAISGQITAAQLPAAGISVTIVTAKLTGGGANGSMTYVNGQLTAQTPAT